MRAGSGFQDISDESRRSSTHVDEDAGAAASSLQQVDRALDTNQQSFVKTALKSAAVLAGVAAAVAGIKSIASAGIDRLTTIQDATASLTLQFGGDAQKTADFMTAILATVKGTPFALDQFADAGKNLVSFGLDAQKVPGYLTAIGDAAAASGQGAEGVDSLVNTIGQLAATGKIDLGSVWDISAKGVPALQILANHFNLTTAAMQKMISDGTVPADEGIQALMDGIENGSTGIAGATNKFGGTMQKLGETFNGSLANLKTGVARLGATILKPWMDDATAGFTMLTGVLDATGGVIGGWSDALHGKLTGLWRVIVGADMGGFDAIGGPSSPLGQFANTVHSMVAFIPEQLVPAVQEAWAILSTGDFKGGMGLEEDSPFVSFVFMLRDVGLDTFQKLSDIWGTLWDAAQNIWPSLVSIGESIGSAVAVLGISTWDLFLLALQGISNLIRDYLAPALKVVADFMRDNPALVTILVGVYELYRLALLAIAIQQGIASAAAAVWAAICGVGTTATTIWAGAVWLLNGAIAVLTSPITAVIVIIGAVVAAIIYAYNNFDWFKTGVQFVWDVIQNVITFAWNWVIKPIFDAIVWALGTMGTGFQAFWALVQQIWGWIGGAIQWAWDSVISPVFTYISDRAVGLGQGFADLWGQVEQFWGWIGDKIQWVWDSIIQPIWSGIQSFASAVGSFFSAIWDGVSTGVTDIQDAIDTITTKIKDFLGLDFGSTTINPNGSVTTKSDSLLGLPGGITLGGGGADGGPIRGPGGPRDDRILTPLSNGEYVVNAGATKRNYHLIESINRGMAMGGLVQAGYDQGYAGTTSKSIPGLQAFGAAKTTPVAASGGGTPYTGAVSGGVEQWRGLVLKALAMTGQSAALADTVLHQMDTESSGNPNAINLTDSNAQKGTPSIGLLQVIGPTFGSYAMAGYNSNIYDPLSNILAAIRYTIGAYGGVAAGMQGHAYDLGNEIWPSGTMGWNTSGAPQGVLSGNELQAYQTVGKHLASGGGTSTLTVAPGAVQITVNGQMTPADQEALRAELESTLRQILADDADRHL